LDFHGISRFSVVFIINNLNAWRYKSGTMYTKSIFRLSYNRSDNSHNKNTNNSIFLLDLLKESLNKLFLSMVPDVPPSIEIIDDETTEKRLIA
jgi:hypothetical protein